MSDIDGLTLSDWAVLGVLRERDAHGFAVAKELAADTELGRIWTVGRSLVYHAFGELQARGLARELKPQTGERGPSRTPLAITAPGRRALARWLGEPVSHIRDYRHQLLLKLALTQRAGEDPKPLVERQLDAIEEIIEKLTAQRRRATGVDLLAIEWRLENARAARRFLRAHPAAVP